jgi:WD40 repeat protein
MSSFDIFGAAVDFVTNTTNRIVSTFINQSLIKENEIQLPATLQKVRQDQRLIDAEIDYYQRREARKQEFLQIQESSNAQESVTSLNSSLASKNQDKLIQIKRDEIADRYKLSALYLDLSRENTIKEIEIKQKEIQGMFDQQKWPGILSRDEIQRIFRDEQTKPRLLMLVPPPDISDDFSVSFRDSLKKEIRNQLKLFLEKYYPLTSEFCPVEFYGKYFERSIFDAEVKQLETILSSVPTAIIYTDITDHEVYFNVKFWGLQEPVSLSFEPWDWEEYKEQLQADGNDDTKTLRAIRQTIVILHKLLAAFLADWYYLNLNPNYEPQLFQLSADFPSVWTDGMLEKLRIVLQRYRAAYHQELKNLASLEQDKKQLKVWSCIDTLYGHSNYVFSVAVNPQGKTFATGSADKTMKVWDIETGENINSLTGHSNFVSSVAFSADGKIIASSSYDKTFKLWYELETKTFIEHSGCVTDIVFSPDGELFATASMDKTLKIWNLKQQALIHNLIHGNYVNAIAFTQDSSKLISCDNKLIKLWNVSNGVEIISISEHSDVINTVAVSPDNKIFATGSHDMTIKLWYLGTGELVRTLRGHTGAVTSVAFSPDGNTLVSGSSDNTIKIWNLDSHDLKHTLLGHSSTVHSVAFSVDGNKIISGSADNSIKIWQMS